MPFNEMYKLLKGGLPILGSGAIGTAPAPASVALGALWVDEFGSVWQNSGTEWIVVLGLLMINGEAVTINGDPVYYNVNDGIFVDENGNILVNENNLILVEG